MTLDGGEKIGAVRDVVLSRAKGRVAAFTVDAGGLLSRADGTLPIGRIHAIGADAIIVETDRELAGFDRDGEGENVIAIDAVSETGRRLGVVSDVVVDTDSNVSVIGFEIDSDTDARLLIREADAVSVSTDALVVSEDAETIEWDELAGFGSALREEERES